LFPESVHPKPLDDKPPKCLSGPTTITECPRRFAVTAAAIPADVGP